MRLRSGKRIGQSGAELTLAVFLSFVLHVLIALVVVSLYITTTPKIHQPHSYQVMLVGLPADIPESPVEETPPVLPKEELVPKKEQKTAPKPVKKEPKKNSVPEFAEEKPKPAPEQAKPAETPGEPQKGTTTGPVTVTPSQEDFKFSWYLTLIREKIGRNWRPPPDARDAKVKVIFTVNRSGWVDDVNLDVDHSTGTFGFKQAAIRAIRSSNPFPPLPEEVAKMSVEFSVDLMAEQ
jgi:TonB family protein